MTHQIDMFPEAPRSYPPHLDPALVIGTRVRLGEDRDHVGKNEVGRYGNNATVFVFEVLGGGNCVLFAESFVTIEAAAEQEEHHAAMIEAHKQGDLFA